MQSVLMRMKCCDRFTDCSDGSDEVGKCTFVASPLKSEDLAGIIIIVRDFVHAEFIHNLKVSRTYFRSK